MTSPTAARPPATTLTMLDHWERATAARVGRRRFLRGLGVAAAASVASPTLWRQPARAEVAPAEAPHLAYGADPTRQVSVSWLTRGPAGSPSLVLDGGTTLAAETRTVAGTATTYHHVHFDGLAPGSTHTYAIDGGPPVAFTTPAAGPQRFTFTAFGDQGTDAVKVPAVNAAVAASGSPASPHRLHLHVGDLCYAYRAGVGTRDELDPAFDPLAVRAVDPAVWDTWLGMITPAARSVPWMPAIGNHEMEPTFGPYGYRGLTGRFALPGTGVAEGRDGTLAVRDRVTWCVDVGDVRFIALDGNDANWEIPGNAGYLPAQDEWLAARLAEARAPASGITWIVVGYHQCSYCTNVLHASDGGLRSRWDALFRAHSVDLVINGHNHSYERAHPFASDLLAPARERFPSRSVVRPEEDGTTFITAGASGGERVEISAYEAAMASYVTGPEGVRLPEVAFWSAARDLSPSTILEVDVDPATSSMTVRAVRPDAARTVVDEVVLSRP